MNAIQDRNAINQTVEICPICMNEADIQLFCGHFICEPCLIKWRKEKTECPLCKAVPRSYIRINSLTIPTSSKSEECNICLLMMNDSCIRCVAYKDTNDPVPAFNKCNCVSLQCGHTYHRHCIGYFHLRSNTVKCPEC